MVKGLFPDPAIASYRHGVSCSGGKFLPAGKISRHFRRHDDSSYESGKMIDNGNRLAGLLAAHRDKGGLKKRPGSESSGFSPVEKGAQIHSAVP